MNIQNPADMPYLVGHWLGPLFMFSLVWFRYCLTGSGCLNAQTPSWVELWRNFIIYELISQQPNRDLMSECLDYLTGIKEGA